MKRTHQILLIVGAILAGIGLVSFAVCMSALGWDFTALDASGPYTAKIESYPAAEVTAIRTDVQNRSIHILRSRDETVTVRFETSEKRPLHARLEGGVLSIVQEAGQIVPMNFFGFSGNRIVIELPAAFAGTLDLATSNGKIETECPLRVANARFSTTNGPVELEEIVCDELEATSSNGRISIENAAVRGLLRVTTSNAPIGLDECRAGQAEIVTSNGRIELEDSDVSGALACQTTNAPVLFDELSSPDVTITTKNGNVTGEIAGRESDYRIESHTSNGSNSLRNADSGSKRLRVQTSNAAIKIRFRDR